LRAPPQAIPRLALEIAQCAELVKGYGDTRRRGVHNFELIAQRYSMPAALRPTPPHGPRACGARAAAALADPDGAALRSELEASFAAGSAPRCRPNPQPHDTDDAQREESHEAPSIPARHGAPDLPPRPPPPSPSLPSRSPRRRRMALHLELPEILDTTYGGADVMSKMVADLTTTGSGSRSSRRRRDRAPACRRSTRPRTAPWRWRIRFPTTTSAGSDLRHRGLGSFGLNARQQHAWLYQGGGNEAFNEFFKKYNVYGSRSATPARRWGGWFRKEIKTAADLSGLKFRIGGIAGQVLQKLGTVRSSSLAPTSIRRWTRHDRRGGMIGPYDDEKLGFAKVAPYYYYPGWWEGGPSLHGFISLAKWEALPEELSDRADGACQYATTWMQARYDAQNRRRSSAWSPAARICVRSRPEIMDACLKATNELVGRDLGEECGLQEIHRADDRVPQRPVSVGGRSPSSPMTVT